MVILSHFIELTTSLTGEANEMDQILLYFPFIIIFLIVLVCLCRLHSDRKSDERAEIELENLGRVDQRARKEAADCSDRIREVKDGASKVIKRTDSIREQIQSASESIKEARRNNKTAAEAVAGIEKIISEAKKI